MQTKEKIKVTIRGDKEITSWQLSIAFELEGEQYDAIMYFDDQIGFSLDAYTDQEKLHTQLRELNLGVWELCTEILDAEESE